MPVAQGDAKLGAAGQRDCVACHARASTATARIYCAPIARCTPRRSSSRRSATATRSWAPATFRTRKSTSRRISTSSTITFNEDVADDPRCHAPRRTLLAALDCRPGAPLLPPAELAATAGRAPRLGALGTALAQDFRFADYYHTIAFVNALAWMANRQDHHPDLSVHYGHVVVDWSTHDAGGVTLNDCICAAKTDAARAVTTRRRAWSRPTHRRHYAVALDDGRALLCVLRGRARTIACGDRVTVESRAKRRRRDHRHPAAHDALLPLGCASREADRRQRDAGARHRRARSAVRRRARPSLDHRRREQRLPFRPGRQQERPARIRGAGAAPGAIRRAGLSGGRGPARATTRASSRRCSPDSAACSSASRAWASRR